MIGEIVKFFVHRNISSTNFKDFPIWGIGRIIDDNEKFPLADWVVEIFECNDERYQDFIGIASQEIQHTLDYYDKNKNYFSVEEAIYSKENYKKELKKSIRLLEEKVEK